MSVSRQDLEARVKRALLEYAIFRPESAFTIAGTLILAAASGFGILDFLPPWAFLGLGTMAEALLIYVSLKDPETGHKVVEDMLHDEFRPERLKNKGLQAQISKALDYRSRIESAIRSQNDGMLKSNLTATAEQIDDWLENIYTLARRLDRHYQERDILNRDGQKASRRVQELQEKLSNEKDMGVRQQIEMTLDGLQKQLQTIESLGNTMKRAELQLEHTLSALGTIYSQAMLVDAKDIDRGRAQRLQHEISEEVTSLSDMLTAMDDVYNASGQVMIQT